MFPIILVIVFAFAPLAAAQVQLQFAESTSIPPNATYSRIVQLPNGDVLFVGNNTVSSEIGLDTSPIPYSKIALAALGPVMFQNGEPSDILPTLGGSGNDIPQAAAVDPSGNIWIVGNTDSDDFNLVNPIVSQKVPYRTAGFVLELDPTGTKLLFATYLGGQQRPSFPCSLCSFASTITAIAIDASGNVYVGGSTDEPDFPTTPGSVMTVGKPGADSFYETFFYSFVTKISPAGKLLYSTLITTGFATCSGGSGCIGKSSTNASISSMAVDATGAVTVAGVQRGIYFGFGYVARLSPDASKLLWTAQVSPNNSIVGELFMAQDSSGNVDLFGAYAMLTIPLPYPELGTPGLFAEKLSSDGSTVIYYLDLGQSNDVNLVGLALDASGNPYLGGTSSSPEFPVLAGVPNLGPDFVLGLDPSGKPQTLFRFPRGTVSDPPAFNSADQLLLPGPTASLLTLSPSYSFNTPAIFGFANAASNAMNVGVFPGELMSLYGFDLGGSPENAKVTIGGFPATVLSTGPNQINIQVPFEIAAYNGLPQIQVELSSTSLTVGPVPYAQSIGIFTSDGIHAAALNEDGTVNSASNPAARGSIISLFGTGAMWQSGQDGALAPSASPLDPEQSPFELFDRSGIPGTVFYAGTAPGLIYGVFQVNVQLPLNPVPPLTLLTTSQFGTSLLSNPVQIYLK